jgi:hypothetical protein
MEDSCYQWGLDNCYLDGEVYFLGKNFQEEGDMR